MSIGPGIGFLATWAMKTHMVYRSLSLSLSLGVAVYLQQLFLQLQSGCQFQAHVNKNTRCNLGPRYFKKSMGSTRYVK